MIHFKPASFKLTNTRLWQSLLHAPFISPLIFIDFIKNGHEWTRKLEEEWAPIRRQEEEGISVSATSVGALEREWGRKDTLVGKVAWHGVSEPDWVRRVSVQGVGAAWGFWALRIPGGRLPAGTWGCWSPGVVRKASTWRRGSWQHSETVYILGNQSNK